MKGRSTKELEQLEHLRLKVQKASSKNVAVTEKPYIPIKDSYLRKLPLILTLQMNQLFNMMFQL